MDYDDDTPYRPLADIVFDIYREMYRKAEPSADFDRLLASGECAQPDWFNKYYLSIEEQEEIVNRHTEHLDDRDHHRVSFEVYFGASPNTHKEEK